MSDAVIVGLMALIGTLAGTFGGILTSAKMTNYRLQQLESDDLEQFHKPN